MSILDRISELRQRVQTDGWAPTARKVLEIARDRISPPWEEIYWMPANQVARLESEPTPKLMVVENLTDLDTTTRAGLQRSVGQSALAAIESRLAVGCEMHLLLVNDEIAGSRFVVFGERRPFQNVVLTPRDVMGMDVRIDPKFRGRGLAPVFFSLSIQNLAERGVERVFASVSIHNIRSRRTLKRVGFRYLLRFRMRRNAYRYDCDIVL